MPSNRNFTSINDVPAPPDMNARIRAAAAALRPPVSETEQRAAEALRSAIRRAERFAAGNLRVGGANDLVPPPPISNEEFNARVTLRVARSRGRAR